MAGKEPEENDAGQPLAQGAAKQVAKGRERFALGLRQEVAEVLVTGGLKLAEPPGRPSGDLLPPLTGEKIVLESPDGLTRRPQVLGEASQDRVDLGRPIPDRRECQPGARRGQALQHPLELAVRAGELEPGGEFGRRRQSVVGRAGSGGLSVGVHGQRR